MVFDTTILGSNPSAPAIRMNKILDIDTLIKKVKFLLFPFYKSPEIRKIFQILEKDQLKEKRVAMFVGGCVRKYLLGEEVDDIDIATVLSPKEIKNKFNNTDVKVIDTGIDHGSVTLLLNKKKFEITTLRKDLLTDGRHAQVSFTDDWKLDSERRDFTINAIYLDIKGKVYDPQLGLNDLKRGIVKFIGDPNKRIEEDYLRIIRFIRFSIQYNHQDFEKSTLEALKLNLNGIKNLSKERIFNELTKILHLKNFKDIIRNNNLKEIFSLIFPELKYLERLKKKDIFPRNTIIPFEVLIAIILLDESNNYEYFCHKYKVSNIVKEKLGYLHKALNNYLNDIYYFKKNLKKNIYYLSKKKLKDFNILVFFIFQKISVKKFLEVLDNINQTSVPNFNIDGKFLLNRGLAEGKEIGVVLNELEKIWLENNFALSDEKMMKVINKTKN